MSSRPVIAVIVLNWNNAERTRQCLQLARVTTDLKPLWIVVDNGSDQPITDLEPDVIVLRQTSNLGFAGGTNVGIHHAVGLGADYIWLLNNDTEPLPRTLDTLVEAIGSDPRIGMASPVILNSDDGDAIDWHGSVMRNGVYASTKSAAVFARWQHETPGHICLTGTALLLSRSLVERIGGFDEGLFAYWEDTDLSLRANAAGFNAIVVSDTAIRHACGNDAIDAAERAPYYFYFMTRNEILLLRKIRAPWRAMYWMLRRAAGWSGKAGLSPRQRGAILRGVVDGLIGVRGRSPV